MGFLKTLVTDHGLGLTFKMWVVYFLFKGLAGGTVKASLLPYFTMVHHLSLEEYHVVTVVVIAPWATKIVWGVLSDVLPCCGDHKQPYIIAAAYLAIGAAAALISGLLSTTLAVAACTAISLAVTIVDLLNEAIYSAALRHTTNPQLISWVWGSCMAGLAVAALIVGYEADSGRIDRVYWVPFLSGLMLQAVGCHDYSRLSSAVRWHVLRGPAGKASVATALIVTVSLLTLFYGSTAAQLLVTLGSTITLVIVSLRLLPEPFASINAYMFLSELSYVRTNGATDYFFTAGCPGTPGFSYRFYTSWTVVLSSTASLAGIWIFNSRLTTMNMRWMFTATTITACAAAFFEVYQALRWNLEIGIPDGVFFAFGEAVIQPVASMLCFMPMVYATAKLVTPGQEATTYALLASYQMLGQVLAGVLGSALNGPFGVSGCSFENVHMVFAVAHVLAPLARIPFIHVLLPDRALRDVAHPPIDSTI